MYEEKLRNVRNVDTHCHAYQSSDLRAERSMHLKNMSNITATCGHQFGGHTKECTFAFHCEMCRSMTKVFNNMQRN